MLSIPAFSWKIWLSVHHYQDDLHLSMERTISIKEERMYPPVLTIINPLHTRFPAYHWRFILFPDYGKPTSNTTLQMVSIGITTKETMASAIVRWKTKKWTLVRLRTSYLGLSQVTFKFLKLKNGKIIFCWCWSLHKIYHITSWTS